MINMFRQQLTECVFESEDGLAALADNREKLLRDLLPASRARNICLN